MGHTGTSDGRRSSVKPVTAGRDFLIVPRPAAGVGLRRFIFRSEPGSGQSEGHMKALTSQAEKKFAAGVDGILIEHEDNRQCSPVISNAVGLVDRLALEVLHLEGSSSNDLVTKTGSGCSRKNNFSTLLP